MMYSSTKGKYITYSDLMKESRKLKADDVINVRIDKRLESTTTLIDFFKGCTKKYTYYATADAIVYKDAVSKATRSNGKTTTLEPDDPVSNILKIFDPNN